MMSKEFPCVHWDNNKCKKFSDSHVTSWCLSGPCGSQQLSNADRIRAMSDEELVKFIGYNSLCDQIQNDDGRWCAEQRVCEHCLVNWLQQPVRGCEW